MVVFCPDRGKSFRYPPWHHPSPVEVIKDISIEFPGEDPDEFMQKGGIGGTLLVYNPNKLIE